jgi:hypothetical protein
MTSLFLPGMMASCYFKKFGMAKDAGEDDDDEEW